MSLRTHFPIASVLSAPALAGLLLLVGGCATPPMSDSVYVDRLQPAVGDSATSASRPAGNTDHITPNPTGLAFAPMNGRLGRPSFAVDRDQRERQAYVGYEQPTTTYFFTVTDDRQLSYPSYGQIGSYDQLNRRAVSVTSGSRVR